MASSSDLRSHARIVEGLGSAKHGVKHWWWQRLTAVVMVPLLAWFMVSLLRAVLFPEPEMVSNWLGSPFNAVAMVVCVVAMFVHAALGVQTVVEDYVKAPWKKYTLLIVSQCSCFLLALLGTLSIIRLHFLDVSGVL